MRWWPGHGGPAGSNARLKPSGRRGWRRPTPSRGDQAEPVLSLSRYDGRPVLPRHHLSPEVEGAGVIGANRASSALEGVDGDDLGADDLVAGAEAGAVVGGGGLV